MYKCKNCGYGGKKLVFQFANYGYCVASNKDEPDFISSTPRWVTEMRERSACPGSIRFKRKLCV